jgi:hypothetical protein
MGDLEVAQRRESKLTPEIDQRRENKIRDLRADAIAKLEEMLADKMSEIAIIQEQLAILSKMHVQETTMVDPYGDTGKYTGQVKNDKVSTGLHDLCHFIQSYLGLCVSSQPHGKGTMKYDDGRVYVGKSRTFWDPDY